MDGIRKVANSGRTIICTIHQPSYETFSVFDNLLLLKRGGETVYYGELGEACQTLVDYFEGIPGVQPLPENYNPATWMLECIGAGVNNRVSEGDDKDFVQRFNKSTLKSHLDATLEEDGVGRSSPHAPVLTFRRKRAAPTVVQLKFLLHRFFYMYWRSPAHSLTILGVALGSLIVLGLVGMGLSTTSFQGVASGLGIIFVAFQFQGFLPREVCADVQLVVVFYCWNVRGDPVRLHEGVDHLGAPVSLHGVYRLRQVPSLLARPVALDSSGRLLGPPPRIPAAEHRHGVARRAAPSPPATSGSTPSPRSATPCQSSPR
ncbi:hypothetical protein ON010_g18953 [Phytophthora cinnamomi]|nr:hypothetical protein ON010_g18953 [Phytophthora cinnamomi]